MADWDIDTLVAMSYPSRAGDPRSMQWGRKYMRGMATPSAMLAYVEAMWDTDVRDLLPLIKVSTLAIHRRDFQWTSDGMDRYVADEIQGARYFEAPGADSDIFFDEPGPSWMRHWRDRAARRRRGRRGRGVGGVGAGRQLT